jgi:integrase
MLTRMDAILQTGRVGRTASEKRFVDFLRQCALKPFSLQNQTAQCFALYVSSMIECRLKPSTIRGYLLGVVKEYKRRYPTYPTVGPAASPSIKYVNLLCAENPTKHAVDFEVVHLVRMITILFDNEELESAWMLFLMLQTGHRCQDLARLKKCQFRMEDTGLSLELRVTKSTRHPQGRFSMSLPVEWLVPFPQYIISYFDSELALKERRETLVPDAGYAIANSLLSDVSVPAATTYSFRRSFMHRIIERFTDETGWVDYERAASYSLHDNVKTLRASYTRHVSDGEREEPDWLIDDE